MIRILIFIGWAILIAGTITLLFGVDGLVQTEAFGQKITMHAGFALAVIIVLFVAVIYATLWLKNLVELPGRIEAGEREARRLRGIEAVTRGLEAVTVGDAAGAQHHARVARRNLDESSLTRLLTAQAAQLSGDEEAAGENFAAMLDAPETEFLGLRGLYAQSLRAGDKAAARGYAERAFRLRPNAGWAFESVLELGLERGAWGETREAVAMALRNHVISADKARRAEAALLTADAYAASVSGDAKLALEEAEAAHKLAPTFAPAAVLAARLHAAAGRRSRAAKLLEQTFAEAPHPALVKAHADLYAGETDERRAERLKRIADRRPTAREAKIALVRRHLVLGQYTEAISALEPLLLESAYAGDYALMAEAVAAGKRSEEAEASSKAWLKRAALARRDPKPGADGEFHFTREGWARLVREYMEHGRLAPPPIEDAPPGLSQDDIRLLAAPPVVLDAGAGMLSGGPPAEERAAARTSEDPALVEGDLDELESEAARAVAAAGKVS